MYQDIHLCLLMDEKYRAGGGVGPASADTLPSVLKH